MSSLSPQNPIPEPLIGFVGDVGGAHPPAQGIFRTSNQRFNTDFILSVLVRGSAASVLLMLGALILILFVNSRDSMREFGFPFFTTSEWRPNPKFVPKLDANHNVMTKRDPFTDTPETIGEEIPPTFGALPMIYGTAVSSALALLIAVPLSFGAALFLVRIGAWLSPTFVKSGFAGLLITAVLIGLFFRSALLIGLATCMGLAISAILVWIAWRVEDPRVGPRRELEFSLYGLVAIAVIVAWLAIFQGSWPGAIIAAIVVTLCLHYLAASFVAIISFLIEFLAAIPSIAYGIWGVLVLSQFLGDKVEPALNSFFGSLPSFLHSLHTNNAPNGRDMLCAATLLAIMILPIITAISRDVLRAVPRIQIEGTQALGATWWQSSWAMLRYGRSGLFGAVMLGLARAAGETMAVVMVMSPEPRITASVLEPVGTMSSLIASEFKDATDMQRSALTEIALILLLMSLAFNIVARYLVVGTKRTAAN